MVINFKKIGKWFRVERKDVVAENKNTSEEILKKLKKKEYRLVSEELAKRTILI